MLNFDFKKSTRKCSISNKEFGRGESYYSALTEAETGEIIRFDYSEESWKGAPENCIGWWKSTVPNLDDSKVYWAPNSVLLSYFQHLAENEKNADETYILSLLMVRKRILQLVDTHEDENGQTLELRHRKTNTRYEIRVCDLNKLRIDEIQAVLAEQLFTNRLDSDDESGEEAEKD